MALLYKFKYCKFKLVFVVVEQKVIFSPLFFSLKTKFIQRSFLSKRGYLFLSYSSTWGSSLPARRKTCSSSTSTPPTKSSTSKDYKMPGTQKFKPRGISSKWFGFKLQILPWKLGVSWNTFK
jgi:hypothetical protein